jgi:signal transduction histidine kinase/ligand-binding sensor domain-containing protein/DNA-binding response OmpR family regulator
MFKITTWIFLLFLSFSSLGQVQILKYNFSHINITKGLSHNQVNAIYQDKYGFIWFGTLAGLNRYDGYNFKVFKHNLKDPNSLSDDYISSILEGPNNNLWILTRNGTNLYDPIKEKFIRDLDPIYKQLGLPIEDELIDIRKGIDNSFWFLFKNAGLFLYSEKDKKSKAVSQLLKKDKKIAAIAPLNSGTLWVIYNDGSLLLINNSLKVETQTKLKTELFVSSLDLCVAFSDKEGDLFLYSTSHYTGVYHYKKKISQLEHLHTKANKLKLNTNLIRGITEDDNGKIWIATDHGGINIYDKQKEISYLVNKEYDNRSIIQNSINTVYKDNSGIIWLGSFKKGISYFHPDIIKFNLFTHQPSNPNSLPYDDVNTFAEDDKGNLWIGTNGGGLIYFDREAGKFTSYKHQNLNPNSLSNNVVVSSLIDHKGKLWVGTYYGGIDRLEGKNFINYKSDQNIPQSLSDDKVYSLYEDKEFRIWAGTLDGGLNRLIPETKYFEHFRAANKVIAFDYVSSILGRENGDLWIGTSGGISVIKKNKEGKIENKISFVVGDKYGLSNANINCLTEDRYKHVWVGTREGLNIYNPKTGKFLTYRIEQGLPDNNIQAIKLDHQGNMWVSSSKGLSKISIKGNHPDNYQLTFNNYDELDGLQGIEFNLNSAFVTKKGELIFGGANGFNLFDPEGITQNDLKFSIQLTDIQVLNKSLEVGEKIENKVVLDKALTEIQEITLHHSQNVISFSFSALSFFNPDKIKYSYKLEGFDKDWITADSKVRKATYTNLDAGEYVLRIRATDVPGVFSNDEEKSLRIIVLPPFWETPLAYFLYLLIAIGILFYIRQVGINKLKSQFALEQERKEAQRIHEMDRMKIRFFTNVSHEFRTPLSLIFAPVEKFLKTSKSDEEKQQFELIKRNARRLLNLVNQLMDFRKMEVQQLKLQLSEGDIVDYLRELSYSFTDLADKKNIQFAFESELESLHTFYDADKLERILFNLLSNAFKFTYENGYVSVHLDLIKVIDTGIGIPFENQEYIFDNFFQHEVPADMMNQGSGIGLSITKEFVKLHGGEIKVESEPDNGSCFTINLPVIIIASELSVKEKIIVHDPKIKELKPTLSAKKPIILLVEDNDDFRFYLKENLSTYFQIYEASNGQEGWQKALSIHPHLVVSDISMPQMNGIDLCKKIRADVRTAYIPLILLTALSDEEQQLKGLGIGANDYMTKPFNFEILLSKIRNLLHQQEAFKKTYTKQLEAVPSKVAIQSINEKFVQDALLLVEQNMSNTNFSVEELSKEMNMSRVGLYKKMLLLTGQSPVAFIRTIRLKRAVQLMENSDMHIAEIAYEVGFNNPKYFTKSFKSEFGYLPSIYLQNQKNKVKD